MQRLFPLLALCLFSSLFCLVADAGPRQKPSEAPEYVEEFSGPRRAGDPEPIKEGDTEINREPSSCPAGEHPPPEDSPPVEEEVEEKIEGKPKGLEEKECPPAEPPSSGREDISYSPDPPEKGEEENSIHFLLIGRWWKDPAAEVLMMVTLIPERCARLTAVDPSVEVETGGRSCPIGELLGGQNSQEELYTALASLTGLRPQFYIDLNLHGFVEMLDLLQRENRGPGGSRGGEAVEPRFGNPGGERILQLMSDPTTPTAAKEKILLELLLAACKIQFTRSGLELLWIGYHNLKTDLGLKDLLEVRKVTQKISPFDTDLTEIMP